ncbi:tRNA pseudouridine(55) synthase TruB [Apibacter muscae]|uniref:tRNA pseudouridine synthase B n=1 Tax=Apibacter muscae TaxID=2509004 RepID=A0A563DFP6_9FLAO|nr:tRNA pseudouridine(55) synthase TruB [Apibacter muscae]TWP28801.1 tRNA pseudouridine(55) synthase TruB [Apibacter muscae]TWP29948.1 tRNA pseudouridine(55) synthase TruB [Apibacter muscae]
MYTLEQLQEGIIYLIDKPLDWTSFDVVNKIKWRIKRHFNVKKIKVGHAGTLDPKATGLLIVCVGKYTKKIQEIQNASKVYTGTIKLGVQTPSYDSETNEINPKDYSYLNKLSINDATKSFIGLQINQTPPLYSALKKEGKRYYEIARKGESIDISARKINIYDFTITEIQLPFIKFKVHCSKGTYIRSLAHDFGNLLGCGGYLTELHREKIGDFDVENANNLILVKEDYFS